MNKNFKHFLSTIIAALFYFLFQSEPITEEFIPSYTSMCIELTQDTFCKLLRGEWTVITSQSIDKAPIVIGESNRNIAVLNVNSIKKAEFAARLGITDPTGKSFIKDGEFEKDGKKYKITREISFTEMLDFYVYYWALDVKKIMMSESNVEFILDQSVTSLGKLISELCTLYGMS